jgi:hypothetical protein
MSDAADNIQLLRQLADCIESACNIIQGVADDPKTRREWLADAEELLIEYNRASFRAERRARGIPY